MKKILLLILFATSLSAYGQEAFNYKDNFNELLVKSKDKNDALFYDKLLIRFTANDTTLSDFEVLALLIGYTDNENFKPYQDLDIEREIYKFNEEEKYQEGLDLANKFLKTHPLSVKALFEKSYALHKLGLKDSAEYYLQQEQRIYFAMFFSGDGKTSDNPTFALGPSDGQDYICKFVGAEIGLMGSGKDKDGNFLDILEAKFEDGETMNLYFIIQHATNKMFDKNIENTSIEVGKKKKKRK